MTGRGTMLRNESGQATAEYALVIVAAAIKLSDRGPVFFRQARVGREGSEFRVWKFRTMYTDAEERKAVLEALTERGWKAVAIDVGRDLPAKLVEHEIDVGRTDVAGAQAVGMRALFAARNRGARRLGGRPGRPDPRGEARRRAPLLRRLRRLTHHRRYPH